MNPFRIIFLLVLIVPIAEIYLFIEVGSVIGAVPTIVLVVLTAVIGGTVIRTQGMTTYAKVQRAIGAGEIPAVPLLEGVCILVAGAFLLTPGFVTDTIGFLFLVPALRVAVIQFVLNQKSGSHLGRPGAPPSPSGPRPVGKVIEGEFERDRHR